MPDFEEIVAEASREIKRFGDDVKKLQDSYDRQFSELETKVDRQMNQMGAVLTRSNFAAGRLETKAADRETLEYKAFRVYMQRGREALEPAEFKALTSSNDAAGGFIAPRAFLADVLRVVTELSPIRQLARDLKTGAGSIDIPTQTGTTTAAWVGEVEQRPSTDVAFGMLNIPLHEIAAYVDVSQRLLDDAALDPEAFVSTDLGEQFAVLEGRAFALGDGVKKPLGFLSPAAGVPEKPSLSATDIAPDSLINALYSLKTPYVANATWVMNANTLAAIRKMKDNQNRYLWSDGAQGVVNGLPGILLGRPVALDPGMPDIAAGSYPIAVGDWARGYVVLNKPDTGMSTLRDPFTMAQTGIVRIHGRLRVGGRVLRPEALVKLKIAAS